MGGFAGEGWRRRRRRRGRGAIFPAGAKDCALGASGGGRVRRYCAAGAAGPPRPTRQTTGLAPMGGRTGAAAAVVPDTGLVGVKARGPPAPARIGAPWRRQQAARRGGRPGLLPAERGLGAAAGEPQPRSAAVAVLPFPAARETPAAL